MIYLINNLPILSKTFISRSHILFFFSSVRYISAPVTFNHMKKNKQIVRLNRRSYANIAYFTVTELGVLDMGEIISKET
jgi:hypothetical protein